MGYDPLFGNKSNDDGHSTVTPYTSDEFKAYMKGETGGRWHMYNWQKWRIVDHCDASDLHPDQLLKFNRDQKIAFLEVTCAGTTFDHATSDFLFEKQASWYKRNHGKPRNWPAIRYPDPDTKVNAVNQYVRRISESSAAAATFPTPQTPRTLSIAGPSDHVKVEDEGSPSEPSSQQDTRRVRPQAGIPRQQTSDLRLAYKNGGGDTSETYPAEPSGITPIPDVPPKPLRANGFHGDGSMTANKWLAHLDETLPYPFKSQKDIDAWVAGFENSLRGPALTWAAEHADDIFEADSVTSDQAHELRSDFLKKFGFDIKTFDGSTKPERWLHRLDNALEALSDLPEHSIVWLEVFASSMRGPAKEWTRGDPYIQQLMGRRDPGSIDEQHIKDVKARFVSFCAHAARQPGPHILDGVIISSSSVRSADSPRPSYTWAPSSPSPPLPTPPRSQPSGEAEEGDAGPSGTESVPANVVAAADALLPLLEALGLH